MTLYLDIYKIIIDLFPYEIYPNLRLVCYEWSQYIETTKFQKVLRLIRTINLPSCYSINGFNKVCYLDGTIQIDDYWYRYKNGSIIKYGSTEYQKVQEINNEYGIFELYHNECKTYVRINGVISSSITSSQGYFLPRFIRTDSEVYIIIGTYYYKYENNQLIFKSYGGVCDLYGTYQSTFNNDYDRIFICEDGKKLGTVMMKKSCGYQFGIGPNYLIIGKDDQIHFWDFQN